MRWPAVSAPGAACVKLGEGGDFMTRDDLGPRICIMGPSNSGKSTLADAIGRAWDLPTVHLDQLFHQPNTDWVPRPRNEFHTLHDEAILRPRWVMDGNYTSCLPQRIERATGLILLDTPTIVSLFRYFRRTWFEKDRIGTLAGKQDSVKWDMIHHIAIVTPRNRKRYETLFDAIALPKIKLPTQRALDRFYVAEGLTRWQ